MPAPPPPPPPPPPAPRPARPAPPEPLELEPVTEPLRVVVRPREPVSPWTRIAAVATLAGTVVLLGVILALASRGDETPAATATPTATPVRTATATPTPAVTEAPTTRSIAGDGFAYIIPSADGWSLSAPQRAPDGPRTIRVLSGPGGELIRIVHSPGVRAEPVASAVVSEDAFDVPAVPDARKVVLEDFPTDRCRDRHCDDYVLNDEAFGGLAILAGDSGGSASRVAARIARSVTARGA